MPASPVPGEQLAATQPIPSKPAPFEYVGSSEELLADYTPEIKQQALSAVADYIMGPVFNPPIQRDNPEGAIAALMCPSGAVNITHPPAADPKSGIMYIMSRYSCGSRFLVTGEEADTYYEAPTGVTLSRYAASGTGRPPRHPAGIPVFKPPYSRITAIDMNTGEHLWWKPAGYTPDRIKNLPALAGVEIGNTGSGAVGQLLVTDSLLIYSNITSDGAPHLFALDKQTGEELARVPVPAASRYGMSSWVHDGKQYLILQTGSTLTALTLP
jgi:outer membrane protein assembly factor BamB